VIREDPPRDLRYAILGAAGASLSRETHILNAPNADIDVTGARLVDVTVRRAQVSKIEFQEPRKKPWRAAAPPAERKEKIKKNPKASTE
jgi:hypothetical protein